MRTRIALTAAIAALASAAVLGFGPHHGDAARAGPSRPITARHGRRSHHVTAPTVIASLLSASTPPPAPPPPPALLPPTPALPPGPPPITDATSTATVDWQCIRLHESGDEYSDPSRPSGAYGILLSTWRSYDFAGWPYQASPAVQDGLALELYHRYGWQPWSTRFACGLAG